MWHVLYLRVLVVLALLEGHVPNMELATLILQQCMSNVRRMPSHRGHLPMKPCVSAQSAQAAEAKMLGRLVNVPRSICKRSDVRAARETPTCGNGGGRGTRSELCQAWALLAAADPTRAVGVPCWTPAARRNPEGSSHRPRNHHTGGISPLARPASASLCSRA